MSSMKQEIMIFDVSALRKEASHFLCIKKNVTVILG